MRSALIVLLVMACANLAAIYIVYNLIPASFTSTEHESENSLIIDEGDVLEAHWQYTTLKHAIFEKLTNETGIKFEMSLYNQNDIIQWDLSIVENQDDDHGYYYYEVLKDEYKRTGDYNYYISSHKYRIYEKPWLYLSSMFREDNYFTNRIIPIEVDDFIKSLNYYIYGYDDWLLKRSKNYTLETNSINIIIKSLRNNTTYKEFYSYNEDGILSDHTIYYENQTAMHLKLIKFKIEKLEPQPPIIDKWFFLSRLLNLLVVSTIIQVIIIIVLISTYDDSPKTSNTKSLEQKNSGNQKNNSTIKGNNQLIHSGNNIEKSIIKFQPCAHCQTLIEENSKFCHNCGKQIGCNAHICQYCDKVKLKDARYCIECGRPI